MRWPTVGNEIEFSLVDPSTGELVPLSDELLLAIPEIWRQFITFEPELFKIEISTPVFRLVSEAEVWWRKMLKVLYKAAKKVGVGIISTGGHPWARWEDVTTSNFLRSKDIYTEHYEQLGDVMLSTALPTGMHISTHIVPMKKAITVYNQMRSWLPIYDAIGSNSPIWEGRVTGLKSRRPSVWRTLPNTGIPPFYEGIEGYVAYIREMFATKSVDRRRKLWFDLTLRPDLVGVTHQELEAVFSEHPSHRTREDLDEIGMILENRTVDSPGDLSRMLELMSLYQFNAYLFTSGQSMASASIPADTITGVKKAALKAGMQAVLYNFATGGYEPVSNLLESHIQEHWEAARLLGCQGYLDNLMHRRNTAADEQLDFLNALIDQGESLEKAVRRLVTGHLMNKFR